MGKRRMWWAGLLAAIPLSALAGPDKATPTAAAGEDEVIIVITPEYQAVDAPLLVVPRTMMSPTEIPVEDNSGALTESYGESDPAPTGKRIPLRQSFTPELKDSVLEQ